LVKSNRMLQVGITGGIGSGKSTVALIFRTLEIPLYDADSHAKELMTTDGNLINDIKREFGSLSFTPNGELNRRYLAGEVFGNPDKLNRLNALVHPRVAENYRAWLDRQKALKRPYIIKEAALLLDPNVKPTPDHIIVVTAPDHLRMERVMHRDKREREEVLNIMERQMNQEDMVRKADFVINNDGISPLIPQVIELHQKFIDPAYAYQEKE
jgi:dephospho-CoA kinase